MTDEEKVLNRLSGASKENISGGRVTGIYIKGSKYDKGLYGKLDDGRQFCLPPEVVKSMIEGFIFSCTVPGKDKRRVYVSFDEVDWEETFKKQKDLEDLQGPI